MNKILIETNSNIGDAVMNVPIINFLHKQYPYAKFDLVCDARSVDIFKDFECVDKIYIKNKKSRMDVVKLFAKLLKTKYDLAIGLRSDGIPLLTRARKKLYKFEKDAKLFGRVRESEYNFSILRKLFPAIAIQNIDTKIAVCDENIGYAKGLIEYREGEKILVVAPGANSPAKVWASENFIELTDRIKSDFDKVVVIGSASEAETCSKITAACGAINLAGKTNLRQAAGLFSLCSFFVGNDSGLGHIAAAQGVPTFIVFAHTDISFANPIRYTPYGAHSIYRKSNDEPLIKVSDVLEKIASLGLCKSLV